MHFFFPERENSSYTPLPTINFSYFPGLTDEIRLNEGNSKLERRSGEGKESSPVPGPQIPR